MGNPPPLLIFASIASLFGVFLTVYYGTGPALKWWHNYEKKLDRVLRHELIIDIPATQVMSGMALAVVLLAAIGWMILGPILGLFLGVAAFFVPTFSLNMLAARRLKRLNQQLVDALTTLSSCVRAGLNLTQGMEMITKNYKGPVQQEFAQILREYQMGMELNQAMRSASNRIGSPLYRLTFTAIEMHRIRGGDSAESMDRIANSIREIQRLEGKLDAITSQSRAQASMLAGFPFVLLGLLMLLMPEQAIFLFTENAGKITLLAVVAAILFAWLWIRRIMRIDI